MWAKTGARGAASSGGPWDHPRLHRQQTLALHLFAGEFASAADGFRFLPDSLLGGFFVAAAELHLAEDALALHLFLQHPEGLVDIVVTDENLHGRSSSIERLLGPMAKAPGPLAHGYAQFGCRWHPRYEPTSTFEIVPADGHDACQLERRLRCRRFLGSSSDKSMLASINGRAGDKEQ